MYSEFMWPGRILTNIFWIHLVSRLIIRDTTGRYTWDTRSFYKEPYSKQSNDPKHSDIIKCMTLRPNIKVEPKSSKLELSYVFMDSFVFFRPIFYLLSSFFIFINLDT